MAPATTTRDETGDRIDIAIGGMSCASCAARVEKELGKVPGKDILIVSIDGTKKATQYILDGKIAEVTECNPKFGPVAFETMMKYAAGEQVPLVVKNVDRVFDINNAAAYLPDAF